MIKPVNSYVERRRNYLKRLKTKRKDWRREHINYLLSDCHHKNSFVERLKTRRQILASARKYAKKCTLKYLGSLSANYCPVCGRDSDSYNIIFYQHLKKVSCYSFGFVMYCRHWVDDELKCCYVRRNLYDKAFKDTLAIDAPVLDHFRFQKAIDPLTSWRY